MSNLRLKDHTWDAANVYDSTLGKTQEQINAEVGTSLAGKQGTLVSGENIKTVNGASILGSGNIEIQGGGGSSVVVDDTLSIAGAAADAKKTGDEIGDLKSAVGNTTFTLDSSILNIKYPVIYASDMSIHFDSPATEIYNNYITGIIPLPETLDGQITHNGYGYSNYCAIVFYDDTKTPISSAANSQFAPIVTPIPNNAAFFRLPI